MDMERICALLPRPQRLLQELRGLGATCTRSV